MAYDPRAIDATLAAAVGDEPALIAELRIAYIASADRALAAIEGAAADIAWAVGAARRKGLAASVGAVRLMALASEAAKAPGDQDYFRKLRRAVERV